MSVVVIDSRRSGACSDACLAPQFAVHKGAAMQTKDQLIEGIQRINPAAERSFLQAFDWHALRRYLDHLHLTLEPRGLESRWRRPGDTAAVVWRRSAA
jgi:hypothetical protein